MVNQKSDAFFTRRFLFFYARFLRGFRFRGFAETARRGIYFNAAEYVNDFYDHAQRSLPTVSVFGKTVAANAVK